MNGQTDVHNISDGDMTMKQQQDEQPGWISGLRQLYDSTLNEPVPDSLEELLHLLDQGGQQPA